MPMRGFLAGVVIGRRVRLERDEEDRDRYGRLLRYVFTEDGWMANAAMVRARLAKVWLFPKARRYRALFERMGKKFGRRKLRKRRV